MARAVQKRTLETRAKLFAAATSIIDERGFEAMRVEEVALKAGVAKGTFFAHFRDKDALMDQIIGARINAHLDELETVSPQTVAEMADALTPLCEFMTAERYVFDVIMRHSGAAAIEEIGAIAETFGRMVEIFESWLGARPFRCDIDAALQAEGVHAFLLQAMAVKFCALHNAVSIRDRLGPYLQAWLSPGSARSANAPAGPA